MAGLGLFLAMLVSGDEAMTVPLPTEERDAVLVRSANGMRLHLFLPREDGTFELRALPPLPLPIRTMALVDADADGDLDLALLLQDDAVALWDGDGKGEFYSHERAERLAHAHHGMLVPALEPAQESALRTVLRDTLARRDPPLAAPGRLPSGRMPRGVVSGRFSLGGVEQTAVVLGDVRPRLAILAADGNSATEVRTPNTTFTVFVGQAGLSFSPSEVTIQPGDIVHWVWSISGHNVTSGSNCTNDNLFCSPSNTGCSANQTSGTGATYDRTFNTVGTFPYFCRPHCAFGMTGTVFVGATPPGILEATNLNLGKSGANTTFTYTPACGATAHAIYFGSGALAPLGPSWRNSICTDDSGSVTVDLGVPAGLQYFVVVGQTASAEGSYGTQTGGAERPEADGKTGSCPLPQEIGTSCP
jgi:plastocyanin